MVNKNFIGSIFAVAGCSMGAGSLALPMLAAGPNFIFTSIAILLIACLSYFVAIVSLEVFLLYKNDVNTATVVKDNFGSIGWLISGLINLGIMYAILSVYMSGGADLLDKTVLPLLNIHLNIHQSLIIFLVVTIPIFLRGASLVVKSNKIVFFIKLVCFLTVLAVGLGFISQHIFEFSFSQFRYLPKAWPIFFTSLWFHFLIPVIAKINDYDRKECRRIFAFGVGIPAVLYVCWVAIMLSLIPRDGSGHTFFSLLLHNDSVGTMINYATYNNVKLPGIMKFGLNLFSNIAMLTSFLTVGLSNYDYIRDAFKINQSRLGVIVTISLTMLPPAIVAILYPNGFVFILQQVSILVILVNIMMLLCVYKMYDQLYCKPGKFKVGFLLLVLCGLIIVQILDNFEKLPSFGIN